MTDEQIVAEQPQQVPEVDVYELQSIVTQLYRERAEEQLRQRWGAEYDSNYQRVQQYLEKLPPDQQAFYNTVDGAEFLAWKLAKNAPVPASDTPKLDQPGSSAEATPQYRFKLSELYAMKPAEKRRRDAEINEAYRLGLVLRDI